MGYVWAVIFGEISKYYSVMLYKMYLLWDKIHKPDCTELYNQWIFLLSQCWSYHLCKYLPSIPLVSHTGKKDEIHSNRCYEVFTV